ncbi:FMRFamide receptor-like [Dreissena polymorpha]|uniref:G-protein coupled receptors family 1 profile domain-containing protein n=1 Tax=Dreissena polymorpha TaxID=45954 RepID=A0A9D4QKN9_DREPO|nr:FMRFamide receptor-like [Dreissena polymorpha]KAH3833762.1 hypothetical protein DPMN_107078 [Dreissena polymorpha]
MDNVSNITNTTMNNSNNSNDLSLSNIKFFIDGVLSIIVIIFGLIGNTLTVIVLRNKVMHSSTNTFLTGLAIWDMVVLLGSLLLITLPELSQSFNNNVHPYVVVFVYPVCLIAQTSTIWITVSFTVERYIAVGYPLKAASMCTVTHARIAVIVVSVAALLYNFVRWFEYQVDSTENLKAIKTTLSNNSQYNTVYFLYTYTIVMLVIPLGLLAVLNTFLVLAVRRSRVQQKTMHVRQARENNVTLMLISVVVVFMICQIPALVYNIIYAIHNRKLDTFQIEILSSTRNFLVTFNSAINFILYCAFGQKFRCVFIRTFCWCIPRDVGINQSMSTPGIHIMTKLDNKKFKSMLHKGSCTEMSHTQQTHLSRYSPYSSRTPSPRHSPLPSARMHPDGSHNELHPNMEYTCKSHLLSRKSSDRSISPQN